MPRPDTYGMPVPPPKPRMIAIFESILPIFLLIVAGNMLRRLPIVDDAAWPGLEQLGYWFLYPALLFITILNADFSGLQIDTLLGALLLGVLAMIAIVLALWPVLRASGLVAHAEYSSVFQTSVRWNGFMALAIAEKIFPPEGSAVVALVMAVIIVPINVASVAVVSGFASRDADYMRTLRGIALNPLILASLAAILMRLVALDLYGPLNQALDLVGRAALGMGLVVIGAGLRPGDLLHPRPGVWIASVLKLAFFPALLVTIAIAIGVPPAEIRYVALCAAVPTALNGFLIARQMGGDAPLYAAAATLQTVLAFFSIPIVLALTAQFASA